MLNRRELKLIRRRWVSSRGARKELESKYGELNSIPSNLEIHMSRLVASFMS